MHVASPPAFSCGTLGKTPWRPTAGLRAGDVIAGIDGEAVNDLGALRRRLSAIQPGAAFAIAVVRRGAGMSLPAELEEEAERRPRGLRRGTGI